MALQVVHRDLKPANVLLSGPSSTVKLCDFGSAACPPLERACPPLANAALHHRVQQAEHAAQPGAGSDTLGSVCGSRWYCSPEALLGDDAHPATDMWSFGERNSSKL